MADVHARVAQRQIERIETGVAAGGRRGLAHQQVGVVDDSFQRLGNGAGLAIELPGRDDRAQLRIRLAALALARVVVQLLVEPLLRQLRHGTAAGRYQLPELFQIVRAGQATRHADDGNGNTGMFEGNTHDRLSWGALFASKMRFGRDQRRQTPKRRQETAAGAAQELDATS